MDPHRKDEEEITGTNLIQIDYTFLGDRADDHGPANEAGDDSDADSEEEEELSLIHI